MGEGVRRGVGEGELWGDVDELDERVGRCTVQRRFQSTGLKEVLEKVQEDGILPTVLYLG